MRSLHRENADKKSVKVFQRLFRSSDKGCKRRMERTVFTAVRSIFCKDSNIWNFTNLIKEGV
ncbi:hypothetical protein D3Z53_01860 [Lachnospiraceae bacterium]|nr:hypothetical protein [Lachnospiraceae bacterium]